MKFGGWIVIALTGALQAGGALAQGSTSQDAIAWLNKIARSGSEVTFSGTYIHQYGNRTETSRVTHVVDEVGEREKLETLDGRPREIIRKNDDIICYIPDAKVMKLDRKRARKFFPALLSNVSDITENYSAKLGDMDRVAGFDCRIIMLDPKDAYRFGHRFCAELNSGLLLRATMVSDTKDVLEQFVFTQLAMGNQVNRELLKPTWPVKEGAWQTDRSALVETPQVDSGWYVQSLPPGFKKVLEVKRHMNGVAEPVIQQIYTDGLASVSVFIENAQPGEKPKTGVVQQGHYNLFVRPVPDQPFNVKVLGEVPRESLQKIGNSLVSQQH
jgi:sigma-E factor negative regulatory protein RseB